MNLKQMNSNLKIMLAVGGWNAGTYPFDQVIANQSTINSFVNDAVMFLRKWRFDGLDIDWEFPTLKKQEFTKLLEVGRLIK
jgi:chitinase